MNIFNLFKSDEEKFIEEAQKYATIAQKFQNEKKYNDAAEYYAKAIGLRWNSPKYWNAYAWNRYLSDQVDSSILEAASIACYLSKFQDYNIFDTKASILAKLGLLDEALRTWKVTHSIMKSKGINDTNIATRIYNTLNTVFVSYEFNDIGQQLTNGIIENNNNLEKKFKINTARDFSMSSINNKVQAQISQSYFLIAIVSKREKSNNNYGISNWIIAEMAIANSQNKELILLVEEGVDIDELSCIRRDKEYISFTHANFAHASAIAIRTLLSRRKQLLLDVMG